MMIARVEDAFMLKHQHVLGAIILCERRATQAEWRELFGDVVRIVMPNGDEISAQVLEVHVSESMGRVMQAMVGVDLPEGLTVPKGSTICSNPELRAA